MHCGLGCRTRNVFQKFYTIGCRRKTFWSFHYVQNENFEKLWRCRKSSWRCRKNHSCSTCHDGRCLPQHLSLFIFVNKNVNGHSNSILGLIRNWVGRILPPTPTLFLYLYSEIEITHISLF